MTLLNIFSRLEDPRRGPVLSGNFDMAVKGLECYRILPKPSGYDQGCTSNLNLNKHATCFSSVTFSAKYALWLTDHHFFFACAGRKAVQNCGSDSSQSPSIRSIQ